MPSTITSRFGFSASTALPARSAASRQSFGPPSPQVAGPCGSLWRSIPITAGWPA